MKLQTLALSLCLTLAACNAEKGPPEPYKNAEVLPFVSHGWYYNGPQLEDLIINNGVKTIIEVGCWLGTSTRHMASNLPKGGSLYAVDHWKGSDEHQPGQPYWIPEVSKLYEYFLSNVVHAGLTDKIIPVRMDSLEASKTLDVKADLVYIDASHDTPAVYADMQAWYPHVKEGGIFCGDDWTFASVQVAVRRFALEHDLKVHGSGNFWQLTK